MDVLMDSLASALGWQALLFAVVGFLLGCFGGVIPGIGSALTLTLLIPFTIGMETQAALMLLMCAYAGSAYAGSIPSILINTPGSPSSAAAALDGYPMAKQGKGTTAIAVSATASAAGSLIGGIFLIAMLPVLVIVVLQFGSMEFLLMAIVGLVTIAFAAEGSLLRGIMAGLLGALLATVGANTVSAQVRYTGGLLELHGGLDIVAVFIGVFAVAEMIRLAGEPAGGGEVIKSTGSRPEGMQITLHHKMTVLRASMLGIFVGIVPGEGGTVSSFMAYVDAKRRSKTPQRFGKGDPEGVVAVEASNNSVISGALVPTLAFGIPGNVTTAVLLGALLLQGVLPGPNMLQEDIGTTYTIIAAVLIGAVLSLIVGVAMAGSFGAVTKVHNSILIPVVLAISLTASYVVGVNTMDMVVAIAFGVIGFTLGKFGYSLIAFVMGFLLGPLAESNLHRVLTLTDGDLVGYTIQRPVSLILILIIVGLLLSPMLKKMRANRRDRAFID